MADQKLASYATISTVMTTELNSLGSSTGKAIGSDIDNTTNLNLYDDLEFLGTWGTGPTVGGIEVYLIPSVDGTNFGDGGASVQPAGTLLVGVFLPLAITSAQRLVLRGIPLPPGHFKYLLKNTTDQALAASGNTFKRRAYNLQVS